MNLKKTMGSLLALALCCCLLLGALGSAAAVEVQDQELNDILLDIQELIGRYGPQIDPQVSQGSTKGTHIHYKPDGSEYFVAIGDASVRQTATYQTYGSLVPQALGIPEEQVTNLGKKELLIEAAVAEVIIPNAQAIQKADMISLGFSANGFALMALDEVLREKDEPTYLDWSLYLPEEGVAEVKEILSRMKAYLIDAGVDGSYNMPGFSFDVADSLVSAAESFAYGTLAYAIKLPAAIEAIRALNPEVTLIIVGMDNPLDGSSVKLNDGQSMELGSYVDKLIGYVSQISQSVALETENAVFIPAMDAANENDGKELKDTEMLLTYTPQHIKKALPNEAGQGYIAECILAGLRLRGDANWDGFVDYRDAQTVLQASVELLKMEGAAVRACDINGSGIADYNDALRILQASVGMGSLD